MASSGRTARGPALVVAAALVVCAGALAADSGGSSKVHACAAKHGGALRLAAKCRHSERAISWGVKGATGPAGPAGAAGAAGPTGVQGPKGDTGNGVLLRDGNGVALGHLVGLGLPPVPSTWQVVTSTGYMVALNPDGTFIPQYIVWAGTSCTGEGYLDPGASLLTKTVAKTVVYSKVKDALFTILSTDGTGTATASTVAFASYEFNGGSCTTSSGSDPAWHLTPVTHAQVGLPATIAAPLSVSAG